MPDPIVTKIVDSDGTERWGSVDAPWVKKLTDSAPDPNPATVEAPTTAEEPVKEDGGDATPVPADGDRPKPRSTRL